MAPPKGFIDLAAAYSAGGGTFVNVIGAVVDLMPPSTTRSNEYMLTFKLLDKHLYDSTYGSQGMTVRFFKADQRNLPKVRSIGDIVLLRQIKAMPWNNQPMLVSNFQSSVLVFPTASIPDPSYGIAFQGNDRLNSLGVPQDVERLSLEEQAYVIHLKAQLSSTIAQIPSGPAADQNRKRDTAPLPNLGPPEKKARQSSFGPKFQIVEELRHLKFADICGQVVKKFPNQFGTCEFYVTDYTENKDMFYYAPPEEETDRQRDGDEYGYSGVKKKSWPGPYGWLVLKVNLKDPHAHFANTKVSEGDFVLLRNVKMKVMKEGAKLEGDLWPDDRNPEKVQVTKLLNPDLQEIRELLARKEKYWAARKSKEPKLQQQQQEGAPKLSKAEKKRQKKQRQQERALAEGVGASTTKGAEGGRSAKRDDGTNKHIRCSNEEAVLTSVRDILDPDNVRHTAKLRGKTQILPFVNAKYRAQVRVVDFEPKAIEEFAVPPLPDEDVDMSPIDTMDWEASPKHEWFFELLLEEAGTTTGTAVGAKEQIWVGLGHEEAQYLLGRDMDDPQDLRSNPQLLAKLREKMCILWGNLEEKKDGEPLSNRSFECCMMEYGIEMDDDDPEKKSAPFGYKRMFRMFGTTIL